MILASACSPVGQTANPACARVRARNCCDSIGDRPAVASAMQLAQHLSASATSARSPSEVWVILRNGCSEPTGFAEGQQRRVGQGEDRAVKGGEHRQLVVGPLDRHQRVAQRLHFFPIVKGAAAEQDMGHAPRLQRAHVAARDVVAPGVETAEQDTYVARLNRRPVAPAPSRCVTVHPLSRISQEINPATALRQRFVNLPFDDSAVIAVGRGHRQRHNCGLARVRPDAVNSAARKRPAWPTRSSAA